MMHFIRDKYATLQFWLVKKTLKEGRDFEVDITDTNAGFVVILKKKKFAGMRVRFSELRVDEINGHAELTFNTLVLDNPNNVDVNSKSLVELTSNIMRLILIGSIEMVNKNELRTFDPDELDEERDVCEEGSAVHQAGVSKRKPRKKAVPRDSGSHSAVQQPAKRKRNRTKSSAEDESHGV